MTRAAAIAPDLLAPRNPNAVRIAQIGLAGGIGYCHLNEYASNPHFQLLGGYDLYPHDPKVADAIARLLKTGATFYRSFEEVLADPAVEAIDICTPHHFHREMAVAAFRAGKHVLCEKPMAPHPDDTEAMVAAMTTAKRIGAVQMQHVGRSSMLQLRQAIQGGGIGQIKEVFLSSLWYRGEEYYSRAMPPNDWPGRLKIGPKWCIDGALFNQCVHYITQMLILVSPTPHPTVASVKDLHAALYKFHQAPSLEAGDTAFATGTLDIPSQAKLTLIGTTCCLQERHQIDILGTKGRALWNGVGYLFPEGQPMAEFHDDNREFDGTSRIFTSFARAIRSEGVEKPLTDFATIQNATRFIYDCYEACQWNIQKAPWSATSTLFSEVIAQVRSQRALPAKLTPKPTWA